MCQKAQNSWVSIDLSSRLAKVGGTFKIRGIFKVGGILGLLYVTLNHNT